jgi:hypothetical protein
MIQRSSPLQPDPNGSVLDTGRFVAIVATNSPDISGDVLDMVGGDLEAYRSNPILLADHDRAQPIGRMVDMQVLADRIVATFQLASKGVSATADRLRSLIAEGIINSLSVAFLPITTEPLPGGRNRFTRWRLAEISTVSVPADPRALILSRASPLGAPAMSENLAAPAAPIVDQAIIAAAVAEYITGIQQRAAPLTVPIVPTKPRTLADAVLASDLIARSAKGGAVKDSFELQLRTLGTPAIGAPGVAVTTPAAYVGPDSGYSAPPRLIDALVNIPVASGHVLHGRVSPAPPNAASKTAEGTAKPAQTFVATGETLDLPTIAVFTKATTQLLADLPAIRQLLDLTLGGLVLDRLDAEVFATLTTAGNFTPFAGAVATETIFDGIARLVSEMQDAGGRGIVVAINPADKLTMVLAKATTSGVYLAYPPIDATVIASPVVTVGSALAWDSTSAALLVREEVNVQVGLDGSDFSTNVRTLLAEVRAAAISRVPARVMYGPLTTAVAGTARASK